MAGKIETKVKAATLATLAASVVIAILNETVGNADLLGALPSWLQFVIVTVAPTAVAFLSGYRARHTPVLPPAPPAG